MNNFKSDFGLALSGGGFRASLFHLGAIHRLNELGLLCRLNFITSVSGGSILAGALAAVWSELKFDEVTSATNIKYRVATNLYEKLHRPLWDFCARSIDVSSFLTGVLIPGSSRGAQLAKQYDRHLMHGKCLHDLPDDGHGPRFVFYGTNLQTGVSVRLQKKRIGDYRLGEISNPQGFSLARAVAISSAFPPVFAPMDVTFPGGVWRPFSGADLYKDEGLRTSMALADGGVYDNMGLEAVWQRCRVVLVSDAGAPLNVERSVGLLKQISRVRDILIEQTRALRKRWLIADFKKQAREGTYWGIATQIGDYKLANPMVSDSPITEKLKAISTRLAAFPERDRGHLVNWGYALADAALRKHVPTHIPPTASTPNDFPVPSHPLPT